MVCKWHGPRQPGARGAKTVNGGQEPGRGEEGEGEGTGTFRLPNQGVRG